MAGEWRGKILSFFSNGTEKDVQRLEEEQLRRERERRRLARLALARQKELEAREKRAQATVQTEGELRKGLLREAQAADHDAKRLKAGEIGLLEAMGIRMDGDQE